MGETEHLITVIVFNLFFLLFIAAIVIYIRQYRIKKKEHSTVLHSQQQKHKAELLSAQVEIQQQTMQHIGREIHDNIGQKLTLASLYAQQLAYENKAPHINEAIGNISAIINQSLSELRGLSKSLTNDAVENTTIAALLENECDKINALKICTASFATNATKVNLSQEIKNVVVRISQEFLQNSIRHSGCSAIAVRLEEEEDSLSLILEDNGKGFDIRKEKGNGIGLRNMSRRAELIGGTFNLQSNNSGTRLAIVIPLINL